MSTATEEDFRAFLSRLAETVGLDTVTPDDDGLVSLSVGESTVMNFYLDGPGGHICCFTEMATLPADAPALLYRDLMTGSLFGAETDGGCFSLEPESNTVIFHYPFTPGPTDEDPQAFAERIERLLELTEAWRDRIRKILADTPGAAPDGAEAAAGPEDGLFTLHP